jgi:PAS domain S-box-containing protein
VAALGTTSSSRPRSLRTVWPWVGLLAGLALTVLTWWQVQRVELNRHCHLQKLQTSAMTVRLQGEMKALEEVLLGTAGFAGRGALPTRIEWNDYVEGLHLTQTYPGIQGLGFVEWIPRAELAAHLQRIRGEGFPEYDLIPGGSLGPDPDGYSSIIYLEPLDARNQRAIARDMLRETNRRSAMVRARDTGLATLTAPITLYQETGTDIQRGILLLAPVYRQGLPLDTVSQRRQALRGWVYFVCRMADFTLATLARDLATTDMDLIDGDGSATSMPLFLSLPSRPWAGSRAPLQRSFEVAGRTWTMRTQPNARFFEAAGGAHHWLTLGGGLMVSVLLFFLLLTVQRAELRARQLADQRGEELLATEAQFQALFHQAPMGMAIVETATGRFLSVNARQGEILGYSSEELLQRTFMDVTHPEHLRADLESVRELATGVPSEIQKEKRYVHRDGHEIWARLSMVRLPVLPGATRRHLAIIEDITEAKRQQAALQASEARFRSLFELSPDTITLSRVSDGTLVMANQAWCDATGIPLQEALDRSPADLGSWSHPDARKALLADIHQHGQITARESSIRHRDGTERQVLISAQAMSLGAEELILIVGKDVSERVRIEAALRESEARFRGIFDFAPDPISLSRASDGTLTWVNPAWCALTGYAEAEVLGHSPADLGLWAQPDERRALQEELRQRGQAVARPSHMRSRDGSDHHLLISARLLNLGEEDLILIHGKDVTEQHLTEVALEASEARYRGLFDLSPDGVVLIRIGDQTILEVNRAWEQITGVSRQEAVGRTTLELGLHQDPAVRAEAYQDLPASGIRPLRPITLRRKDGSPYEAEYSLTVLEMDGERSALVVQRDVTERNRAAAALKANENRFRGLFEKNRAVKLIIDPVRGTIMDANPAAAAYYGWSIEELRRRRIQDLNVLPPEQVQAEMDLARREERAYFRFQHRLASGEIREVEVYSSPVEEQGRELLYSIIHDVTERSRMQAELSASEARFRVIAEQCPVALFLHRDGRFVYVNPAGAALFAAADASQLIGQPILERVHPEDRPRVVERVRKAVLAGEEIPLLQERFLALDGTVIEVEAGGCPVVHDGLPTVLLFAQDITARKRAEVALRLSEARLRLLGDQLPDSFLYQLVEPPGGKSRFSYLSTGVERLCGLKAEDIIRDATLLFEQVDPAVFPAYLEAVAVSARDLTMFAMDLPQRRADGVWRWFRVRSMPRRQPDGTVIWEGISSDITDQKASQVLLEESENRFRMLIENAPVVIWMSDSEGRLTHINRGWERWTGLDQAQALGLGWTAIIHPEDKQACHELHQRSIEARVPFQMEVRMRHHSGAYRWISDQGSPRFASDGTLLGYIGACLDLQSMKDAEANLRESELRTRKAESLVLMAGGIAHDFNNLFQALSGNLEIAAMRTEGNDALTQAIHRAQAVLHRAVSLSWKMLDFSGHGFLHMEPLDLESWLPEQLALFQRACPPGFHLDLACEAVPRILADRSKLEQMLKAILDNAQEAAGDRGGRARLRLSVDFGGDRPRPGQADLWPLERPDCPATICLEIADDGPGVPPERLGLICDPFYSTKAPGRGLGLPASLGILRTHRAGLHILNGAGKGLILRLHFPPA